MQGLSSSQLVSVWERGLGLHPVDRALAILAEALPDEDWGALCDLPLGQRDERLLALRARTFGPRIDASARCPRCDERVQLTFQVADISGADALGPSAVPVEPEADGTSVDAWSSWSVRPLTSRDLAAAAGCATTDEARRLLARRSVTGLDSCGDRDDQSIDAIANDQLDAIAERLEQLDPAAVRTLALTCTTCRESWDCDLDVAEFLWTEIEAAALRLLRDVHTLARSYGWGERDILAMSPIRRRAYLELAQ